MKYVTSAMRVAFMFLALGESRDSFAQVSWLNGIVRSSPVIEGVAPNGGGMVGGCCGQHFSADGRWMVFESDSDFLVADDFNGRRDVFLRDLNSGAVTRISVSISGNRASGGGSWPSISADGRWISFSSSSAQMDDNSRSHSDIYVHDRVTGLTTNVTATPDGPGEGGGNSDWAAISGDGKKILFTSSTRGLVADAPQGTNIYVRHMATGTFERIADLVPPEFAESLRIGSISMNGDWFVYSANVPQDANEVSHQNVFAYDLRSRTKKLLSVGMGGVPADGSSSLPSISADGRFVAFGSNATNLVAGDSNGSADAFVADLVTGQLRRVSLSSIGAQSSGGTTPVLTANGQYVFFSASKSLMGEDNGDGIETLYRVGVDGTGLERLSGLLQGFETFQTYYYQWLLPVSFDGHLMAATVFSLDNANPQNYLFDVSAGTRQPIATTFHNRFVVGPGNAQSGSFYVRPVISQDGRYVTYQSEAANLAAMDRNDKGDVYRYDRYTHLAERVSVANDGSELPEGGGYAAATPDGRYIVFVSESGGLNPDEIVQPNWGLYVRDMVGGTTQPVAKQAAEYEDGVGIASGDIPTISADGRLIAFASGSTSYSNSDVNGGSDIFLVDRHTHVVTRVSNTPNGNPANGSSYHANLSHDGKIINFISDAPDLVPPRLAIGWHVYRYDVEQRTMKVVTASFDPNDSAGRTFWYDTSSDGRYVLFSSDANNLIDDGIRAADMIPFVTPTRLYIRDSVNDSISRVPLPDSWYDFSPGASGIAISSDGRRVAFGVRHYDGSGQFHQEINEIAVVDLVTGSARLVRDRDGTIGNGIPSTPSLSANGTWVSFSTRGDNWALDEGHQGAYEDVFMALVQPFDFSGAFYDPTHSGHGWLLEEITQGDQRVLAASWYAYRDGEQLWMIGTAPIEGDRALVPMTLVRGGDFPPNHDAANLQTESFGTLELVLSDNNNGHASWTSTLDGLGSGEADFVRLTQVSDSSDASAPSGCTSGSWYNPAQSGHGMQIEVVDDGAGGERMLGIWYHYLNGEPRWILGSGPVQGDHADLQMAITDGPDFPPAYDPAELNQQPWGSLRFTVDDANHAHIDWDAEFAGYADGSMDLQRLTQLDGHACIAN